MQTNEKDKCQKVLADENIRVKEAQELMRAGDLNRKNNGNPEVTVQSYRKALDLAKTLCGCPEVLNILTKLVKIFTELKNNKDAEEAQKAYNMINADLQFQLAQKLYHLTPYDKANLVKAFSLYQSAAAYGFAPAELALGNMYMYGITVPQNYKIGSDNYKLAADKSNDEALYRLALVYQDGCYGLPKDDKMAAELLQKAANQGYLLAQYELGKCYEMGIGVKQDNLMAFKYYQLVANAKYKCGIDALQKLLVNNPSLNYLAKKNS